MTIEAAEALAQAHMREDRRRLREQMIAMRGASLDAKVFDKLLRTLDA